MASLNALWARAVVQELVRAGVAHAIVAPGSRNAPLVLACAEAAPGLACPQRHRRAERRVSSPRDLPWRRGGPRPWW